jgi:hypothetical protein
MSTPFSTGDCYADGSAYRGQPLKTSVPHASDCAVHRAPAYPAGECDCQDTAECLKSGVCMSTPFNNQWLQPCAAIPVDMDTVAALVTELKRCRYLIERTYYIHEDGSIRQRLMDNLLADVARDVLEGMR